jgi:hypothetical protein
MIRIDACMLQVALAIPMALWLAFGVRRSLPFPAEAGIEGSSVRQSSAPPLLAEDKLRPGSNRIYVAWGGVFAYQLVLDDEDFATLDRLNLVALGCLMQTPVQKDRLRDLGIADLYRSVFEDP